MAISVKEALVEYERIVGEHEDGLCDDEFDELPQQKLEDFLNWCEQNGDPALVNEVIECLKVGHTAKMALRFAACYASRRRHEKDAD